MLIRFIMQENAVSLKAFHSNHTFHAKSNACDFKLLSAKELCFFPESCERKAANHSNLHPKYLSVIKF